MESKDNDADASFLLLIFVVFLLEEEEKGGRGKLCFCKNFTDAISANPNTAMTSSELINDEDDEVSHDHPFPIEDNYEFKESSVCTLEF